MTRPATKRAREFSHDASGWFVVRTPLLPVEDVLRLFGEARVNSGMSGAALAAALEAERAELRATLAHAIELPEIREALFLASPTLLESAPRWRRDPERESRTELSLLRYLIRMATRPTPFGLFAGYSLGTLEKETRIELLPRNQYRRQSRLDMEYIAAVSNGLELRADVSEKLYYRPNSSLYEAYGRLRYVEDRRSGRTRSYHLVSVERSDALSGTLERARASAMLGELAEALVNEHVSLEDARGFVSALIECRILISNLEPRLTGPDTLDALLAELEPISELRVEYLALQSARSALREIDARAPGCDVEQYHAIAESLRELPAEAELHKLFQSDLQKPAAHATLGPELLAELTRAIDVLHRISPRRIDPLIAFRRAFIERYEGREVPLTEALDDELGIGYGPEVSPRVDDSALLAGLPFPATHVTETPFTSRDAALLQLLERVWSSGARVLELSEADITRLSAKDPAPLPDAFAALVIVARAEGPKSQPSADQSKDELRLFLQSVTGPSGVRLIGRFCANDAALQELATAHLASEEALQPGAVFAEIVCQPQDRVGNVLARPVLRKYEIPYLGRSGAEPARQIPITDLYVRIANDRVVLRSKRLNREVIPRLTTAHFHSDTRNPTLYRFLAALQPQGLSSGLGFSFGVHEGARFLPRVVFGKTVFARARWLLFEDDLRPLRRATGAARFAACTELRERLGLPRWVVLVDDDHELVLDLDRIHAIDALLERERSKLVLCEWYPAPDALLVNGPEGRFASELLVPFVRKPDAALVAVSAPERRANPSLDASERVFAPGSGWLYAKLYSGVASLDRLLTEVVAPLVREALADNAANSWFFLRYADPEPHLRVRLSGDAQRLYGPVLSRLHELVEPLLNGGVLRRLELGTYERELERYAGARGMELSERLFCADSEAALELATAYPGDAGQDARWRLALLGMHQLFDAFGFSLEARLALSTKLRDAFAEEFEPDRALRDGLRERFRSERANIAALLSGAGEDSWLAPGYRALCARSQALAPLVAALRATEARGELTLPVDELLPSYLHLFVNRVIRSDPRAHEFVLYELLAAHYRSALGRARAEAG